MTIPIVLRLDKETVEVLDNATHIKECTRTKLLRNAVNNYLKYFKDYEEPRLLKMQTKSKSFYEAMIMGH